MKARNLIHIAMFAFGATGWFFALQPPRCCDNPDCACETCSCRCTMDQCFHAYGDGLESNSDDVILRAHLHHDWMLKHQSDMLDKLSPDGCCREGK